MRDIFDICHISDMFDMYAITFRTLCAIPDDHPVII